MSHPSASALLRMHVVAHTIFGAHKGRFSMPGGSMSERLSRLVGALMPVMNRVQAEGFLHLTATCRDKTVESLSLDDWPALERMVRDALAGTRSEEQANLICMRLREAFIDKANGSSC